MQVDTRDGKASIDVLVIGEISLEKLSSITLTYIIGDPCSRSNMIPWQAPEVRCENNQLVGATRSTNGHIVIGLLRTEVDLAQRSYYRAPMLNQRCQGRKQNGYRNGMGRIFVEVASINPIN